MHKFIKLFIILISFMCLNVYADTTYIKGTIAKDTTGVYLRPCAGTTCGYMKSDTGGSISISYPETFEILEEVGNFYKINLQFNGFWYEGYISKGNSTKSFVDKKEYIIKDATINEFQTMGFDITYAKKLAILKTIHPNWNFKTYEVNATWDEVIKGETKYLSTNLVDGTNTSLRSTADGAYVDGKWTTFSGGNWYAASSQTIKYYVDPRNFLNDGHIFMFEVLSFDEKTQTEAAIQSLLNGSFMSGNTFYYNDKNEKVTVSYAKAFIDSGKKNGISAIHLVSRVLQEQGSKGSALSSGDNSEYPGYYNFFNVNANGSTTAEVIHNGLAYAKKKNWNSPYASIIGGGDLLNSYVKNGQDTLYLQKFDLVGSTYYTNQYMQNIRAPYSESYSAYKTYVKNNLLDSTFTFSIPIFKGTMPTITSLSSEYNEDSTLSSLTVTGCNLMPSFTSNAYNYTCNVDKNTNKVTINAKATSSNSIITGTGDIELKENKTETSVVVKSAVGTTSTYKITINKLDDGELSPDEILSKLQINNASNYLSGFDLGSSASSLNKLITDNYPSAKSEISSNDKLSTGMTLKLTNNGEANYTRIIYGDNNGDGAVDIVDLLKVQKSILNVKKLKGAYEKASDVNKDGTVDIVDLLKIQKHILNVKKLEQ